MQDGTDSSGILERAAIGLPIQAILSKRKRVQMNDYMARYVELSKAFHTGRSPASVEALYALADELKNAGVEKAEAAEALSNTYALLGLHQSAHDAFLPIYDENDMKQEKSTTRCGIWHSRGAMISP
jgi:hypothetical protein